MATEKVAAAELRVGDTIVLRDGRWVITRKRFKPKTMVFGIRQPGSESAERVFDYTPHKTTMIKREAKG